VTTTTTTVLWRFI